jgi:ubiquinone/menaquinone biosynthesis C-methylase UbiE
LGNDKGLNVGAGYTDYGPRVFNMNIFDSDTTSVVASAPSLPFPDSIADLVIMQVVLEHVEDADTMLKECIRSFGLGGAFYTEMPFLQPYREVCCANSH